MRGEEVVRMVPYKDGKANRGHSCVKGRFAWGYATHKERILKPMIRDEDHRPVAAKCRGTRRSPAPRPSSSASRRSTARGSVGGITSSRCTNEETFLVQKLIRAGFGNNNVDTCARVCHSPTGYGLAKTFGTSAGTQDFDSVEHTDVVILIGANPTDAHPVFASRMKKRLRAGRQADRHRSAPHRSRAHAACRGGVSSAAAARHQRRGADRARACHRHRRAGRRGVRARALRLGRVPALGGVRRRCRRTARRRSPRSTGVPAETIRGAARLYATGGNGAIYYGLGVTEHSQGSTTVMAHRQPRHGDRQYRPPRRRREPAARPEQRAGLLRHGLVPARTVRLPPYLGRLRRGRCSRSIGA